VGDFPVFNSGAEGDIPIVHRLLELHQKSSTSPRDVAMLTKGDNNLVHDRPLYKGSIDWIQRQHVIGRAWAYLPYAGLMTIWMNDYPMLKFALIGVLGLFVIINRE